METVRTIAPLVLLLMCGLTLLGGGGDRVIAFTPGEVNFLFPGPFTRRELLLYKLARTFAGGVVSGLVISIVLLQHAASWRAAFIGAVLAMILVQLLTIVVVLAAQILGKRAYSIGRRAVLALVIGAIALALAPVARELQAGGFTEALQALRRSTTARIVLAPFVPFAMTFTAMSIGQLALWAGVAALIDLALLAMVLRLDTDYREAALAASQRTFDRLQRMRRGQLVPQIGGGTSRRGRLRAIPMLPWLGGAGPTAWRQIVSALRTSRTTLLMLLIICAALAVPMLLGSRRNPGPLLLAAVWLTFFLAGMLRFDFRAELDQMPWLKALPLGPTATAAGQLVAPVLALTLAQSLLVVAAAILSPAPHRPLVLAVMLFLLPFNLLLMAVENLLFLLFPSRVAGVAPGDLGHMGRQVVFFLLKLLIVFMACGIAAAMGFAGFSMARGSLVIGGAVALFVLCGIAVGMVPWVGAAYRRFDPSTDTPT